MKETELIKTYEFDGTPSGFKLMIERLFDDSTNKENYFNPVTRVATLQNGLILKKEDHYQVRLPEHFKCI
jgi:hypothetical protein